MTMQHENVFTQMNPIESVNREETPWFHPNTTKNIKIGWKTACTLLFGIALTLECINVTLNTHCRQSEKHYNHTSVITSFFKSTPNILPGKTDQSIDLCAERREFPLRASYKRINVCTYKGKFRVDFREFLNDKATVKGIYFTTHEFIVITDVLPLVRHELLRQLELLRNT